MRNFDDHKFLYKETAEMEAVIAEAEKLADHDIVAYGVHKNFGKARHSFNQKRDVKVSRVRKIQIDMSSQAWKDYSAKKINFSEMKKRLKLK